MKMLGEIADEGDGFDVGDLMRARANFEALGCECEMVDFSGMLRDLVEVDIPVWSAGAVLIIRGGAKVFGDVEEMKKEMVSFEWDKKYWCSRRKKVLNKHARANVCFDVEMCEADYENGQGTIVGWDAVPETAKIRAGLKFMLGKKGTDLVCEGNQYFSEKCGIGFHGDAERRKVAFSTTEVHRDSPSYRQLEWEYRRLQTRLERLRSENLDLRGRLKSVAALCAVQPPARTGAPASRSSPPTQIIVDAATSSPSRASRVCTKPQSPERPASPREIGC